MRRVAVSTPTQQLRMQTVHRNIDRETRCRSPPNSADVMPTKNISSRSRSQLPPVVISQFSLVKPE